MKNRLAPIFVIFAASLWGIDGIILRPALYSLPVTLVVFIESAIVALLLLPILFKNIEKIKSLKKNDWFAFLAVGLLGGAIGTMAITKALFFVNYVNLSVVILIQKLQPVFALLLASFLLKEKLPRVFFIWAAAAIAGTYLLTFGMSLPNLYTGGKTILAAGLSLIAAIGFSSSTVFSKRALKNVSFEIGTYLRFSLSAIIMLIITTLSGTIFSLNEVSINQWGIFFLIAFTTGGAAIFLYYYGLKNISASVATICELAFPLTAILLEYYLHKNFLNPIQWIGAIILVFSIIKVSGINLGGNKSPE